MPCVGPQPLAHQNSKLGTVPDAEQAGSLQLQEVNELKAELEMEKAARRELQLQHSAALQMLRCASQVLVYCWLSAHHDGVLRGMYY